MTKILHGCLDGIRTVPSNGKIMLIVKNMLGQETLYSTHSLKVDIIANLLFFYVCILQSLLWWSFLEVIIIVNRFFEQKFFNRNRLLNIRGGVQLLRRVFTLYMMVTFPRKHFVLGPKSVGIFSCNTTTGFSFVNFVRKIFYWYILCFISN